MNRCCIASAQGPSNLSIPLIKGRDQRGIVKDIRIAHDQKWQTRHWKTIESAYNRSPWFDHYQIDLSILYQKKFDYLWEWNLACFQWTLNQLMWESTISVTSPFDPRNEKDRGQTTEPVANSPGFIKKKLPVYTQVFQDRTGFLENLSILDLIFCQGRRAGEILQ